MVPIFNVLDAIVFFYLNLFVSNVCCFQWNIWLLIKEKLTYGNLWKTQFRPLVFLTQKDFCQWTPQWWTTGLRKWCVCMEKCSTPIFLDQLFFFCYCFSMLSTFVLRHANATDCLPLMCIQKSNFLSVTCINRRLIMNAHSSYIWP